MADRNIPTGSGASGTLRESISSFLTPAFDRTGGCITLDPFAKEAQDFCGLKTLLPFQHTFPNDTDTPACCFQCRKVPLIPFDIPADFAPPELLAGFRPFEQRAVMPVPETPVHKYHGPVSGQHQIRPTCKLAIVQPITKPASVKPMADEQFGFCIDSPDRRHVTTARFRGMDVSQLFGPGWPPALAELTGRAAP